MRPSSVAPARRRGLPAVRAWSNWADMAGRVQAVLERSGSLVFPGVYDALSAKLAERAGFELAFVSGYAVSATSLGEPDVGLLTQTEVIERARVICRSVSIPIIVDADTGYGNPLNVVRTVRELIAAGAAGCFLEDQRWPKRCGHMRHKTVVARDEYLAKIRAAVDAKEGADFFLVARTDAIADGGLEEALARAEAARAAGADATFVEAPRSLDELAAIGRRAPKPTVANMIEQGRTPLRPRDDAGRARLPARPLSPDRPVRRGARARDRVRHAARGRDVGRGRGPADRVREVQPDRRSRRAAGPRRGLRPGDIMPPSRCRAPSPLRIGGDA